MNVRLGDAAISEPGWSEAQSGAIASAADNPGYYARAPSGLRRYSNAIECSEFL
jgi:hypothetical protein